MVQILPYVQSPLEQLTPYINQAATDIAGGFKQRSAAKRLEALMNPESVQGANDSAPNSSSTPRTTTPATPRQGFNPTAVAEISNLANQVYGKAGADAIVTKILQDQKLADKEALDIRKEERSSEREFEKTELSPFFENIANNRKILPSAMQSNEQIIDAIINGNVGPGSLPHIGAIARDLGVPDSITKALESTDSKEFNSGVKQLMGRTIKDTFRGTTSAREIQIAESVQAEIGVRPEANLAAAWAVQSDLMIKQEELRLYDQLLEQGVPRSKIPSVVNKQISPFIKQVKDEYFQAIDELREKK